MLTTSDFKHLGAIKTDLDKLKDWCYSQLPTMTDSVSNYTVGGRKIEKQEFFSQGLFLATDSGLWLSTIFRNLTKTFW